MFEDCVLQSMRFPQKLWRIVNECRTGAIRWGANGDTVLLDYKRFQTEYLDARRPIFKTTNITSFIRQLNLYGFRKVTAHNRDPACNFCNPHVHEFTHNCFRADRLDLLSKVYRKTGVKGKCPQHDVSMTKLPVEDNSRTETSPVSRLKLCQLALTTTLKEIAQEYQKNNKKPSIISSKKDNQRRLQEDSKDTGPVLYKVNLDGIHNTSAIEQNAKYLAFLPPNANVSSGQEAFFLPLCVATVNKYGMHLKIPNIKSASNH